MDGFAGAWDAYKGEVESSVSDRPEAKHFSPESVAFVVLIAARICCILLCRCYAGAAEEDGKSGRG